MMKKPDLYPPNESTRQDRTSAELFHRRLLACLLGGGIAGSLAALAAAGFQFVLQFLAERWSIWVHWRHDWFVHRNLVEVLAWVVAGFMAGWVGGLISVLLPARTRYPPVLAVFWASFLGSIGLILGGAGTVVGIWNALDLLEMTLSFLIPGAVYGFVLGWNALVLERIVSRFTRPAATSEPSR